jgi:tetratricopeptide (TPR) repeat protein
MKSSVSSPRSSSAAFDAYLRGKKAYERSNAKAVVTDALAAYTEAIRLDPNYSLAFAGRSIAYSRYAWADTPGVVTREVLDKALADAHQALALAPELAEGHLALAIFFAESLDFAKANEAFERARTLAPGNAWVLRASGGFAAYMGHFEAGVTALSRAVVLDPLNPRTHAALGDTLYVSRRYQEAVAAARKPSRLILTITAMNFSGSLTTDLEMLSERVPRAKPSRKTRRCSAWQ